MTTATAFLEELHALQSDEELEKYQTRFGFEKAEQPDDHYFIGVRMGEIFDLANVSIDMNPAEIETLLESPIHEARVGAVSIMDWQARRAATPEERRRELYELFLRRHDRIDQWDLVDRAAPHVIGGYLFEFEQPTDVLAELAQSDDVYQRRTAIYSTSYAIRQGAYDLTFDIAERLLDDDEESIQKAVGGWLREIGKRDPDRLSQFLDRHAAQMTPLALGHATKYLDEGRQDHYRNEATT